MLVVPPLSSPAPSAPRTELGLLPFVGVADSLRLELPPTKLDIRLSSSFLLSGRLEEDATSWILCQAP